MRAARFIGVAIATLGIAATAAAPVAAEPMKPKDNVYLAQIRYQALPEQGPNGEYVKLTNGHNYYVNVRGWTLTERADNHRYRFPDKWLAPGGSVWLYSGFGFNRGANLFWDSRTYLWNNQSDTAILRNGRSTVIDTCTWRTVGSGYTNCR